MRFLILFEFLLPDNSVERIELKNLLKFRAVQIVLNFFNFDLDFNLEITS